MVLWARWLADGNPVPPGHPRQGPARPGFRDEDARAARTDSDVRQRSAVRHAGWGCRADRGISRVSDPGAVAPSVRPAGPRARLQSPADPGQLEALRREYPRQL